MAISWLLAGHWLTVKFKIELEGQLQLLPSLIRMAAVGQQPAAVMGDPGRRG